MADVSEQNPVPVETTADSNTAATEATIETDNKNSTEPMATDNADVSLTQPPVKPIVAESATDAAAAEIQESGTKHMDTEENTTTSMSATQADTVSTTDPTVDEPKEITHAETGEVALTSPVKVDNDHEQTATESPMVEDPTPSDVVYVIIILCCSVYAFKRNRECYLTYTYYIHFMVIGTSIANNPSRANTRT